MKKYRVSLEVDKEWVKNFDLIFDAEDEQDAEAQAMTEVKMNLGDYITAYADEEEDTSSKQQATSAWQIINLGLYRIYENKRSIKNSGRAVKAF